MYMCCVLVCECGCLTADSLCLFLLSLSLSLSLSLKADDFSASSAGPGYRTTYRAGSVYTTYVYKKNVI